MMMAIEYDNGRIRLRQNQAELLDRILHEEWVKLARQRAAVKAASLDDEGDPGGYLVDLLSEDMRLIGSIQRELSRTFAEMGWTPRDAERTFDQ